MNTQNTPVHIHLWHRDFWLLSIINLLITMAVYMLIPVLPIWMQTSTHFTSIEMSLVMGSYGVGLFLLGGFCNRLVQVYRRNNVCLAALFLVILSLVGIWTVENEMSVSPFSFYLLLLCRIVQGASFGLVQMILSGTLIIDKSESAQRTEANHASAWFGRFALSLGPMLAIILSRTECNVLLISAAIALTTFVLLRIIRFPFKTPDDNVKVFSTDRFFLPSGKWLFLNLFIINTAIGILMTIEFTALFYALIMVGFCLSLLAERYVFVNADLKSEIITGLILIGAALLMMLTRNQIIVSRISPILIGLGIGLIGARFLLFFIKLSKHCQRGTALSTYILSWESGIAFGLFAGYAFFFEKESHALIAALIIVIISAIMYLSFVHAWYIRWKNR